MTSNEELDRLLQQVLEEDDVKQRTMLYQQFLRTKEAMEEYQFTQSSAQSSAQSSFGTTLYPHHQDPQFASKLASKKEFQDTEQEDILYNPETRGDELATMEFELAPHQQFVRNFLSAHTPYNSLLLFHGLGTGKTCSAISVCEEVRETMKQTGDHRRILIVASPNVQGNFKRQLFDSRKIKDVNGTWTMRSCTGNRFLQEVNPMNMKGLSKEAIEKQIDKLINQSYIFMGYQQFGNYIEKLIAKATSSVDPDSPRYKKEKISILKKEFSNRMIVIDEVHNIRISDDNTDKKVAEKLLEVVNYSESMKLLLLSATPMFNNYREILWLLNLMNMNDKRARIRPRDVFTKAGKFVVKDGQEVGKQLLLSKSRGYVSYVRGENPYSFPYRIFPSEFDPENTFSHLAYPSQQVNGKEIETDEQLKYIDVYMRQIGTYQEKGYSFILDELKEQFPTFDDVDRGLGYQALNQPVQSLNIVYPMKELDKYLRKPTKYSKPEYRDLVGGRGLSRIMTHAENKTKYKYKSDILEKYGRIFEYETLKKYSGKMSGILQNMRATASPQGQGGIILIYSEYIDGGCVPMALALEEMGFRRYKGNSSLLSEQKEPIDALTFLSKSQFNEETQSRPFKQASYIMITGDRELSPDGNDREVKAVTTETNIRGEEVRVIIMSKAGSEGLDFRLIRQVHILDPWFNMNRIEQIIGRAVRTFSHIDLPFKERNVQIFLYASLLSSSVEAVDLYMYRLAEKKAIQIGKIARLLKENAVDCRLNYPSTSGLTAKVFNQSVNIQLANGETIEYKVGDKPFTATCDYMETCAYKCLPYMNDEPDSMTSHRMERKRLQQEENVDTYHEEFIANNTEKIKRMIGDIVGKQYIVHRDSLLPQLNKDNTYPLILLYTSLQQMIENEQEVILDKTGRSGRLVNLGDYYVFQPIELSNTLLTYTQRAKPLDITFDHVNVSWTNEPNVVEPIGENPLELLAEKLVIARIPEELSRGEKDWYKLAAYEIERMSNPDNSVELGQNRKHDAIPTISSKTLLYYVACHYIEKLDVEEKLNLFTSKKPTDKALRRAYTYVQRYLEENLLPSNDGTLHAFYTPHETERLYIREYDWREATPAETLKFNNGLASSVYDLEDYSQYVGFMILFNKKEYVFKVKNIEKKRHKGARCDQASKGVTLKLMNEIMEKVYNAKEVYTTKSVNKIPTQQICIEQEFLLRYFNDTKEEIWFLSPEKAVTNKIEKLYRDA